MRVKENKPTTFAITKSWLVNLVKQMAARLNAMMSDGEVQPAQLAELRLSELLLWFCIETISVMIGRESLRRHF